MQYGFCFFARRDRNWKSLSVSTLENCTHTDRNQQCPNPMKYSTTCRFAAIIIDQEAEIWIPNNIPQYWRKKNFQTHKFLFRGKTELKVSTMKFTCQIVFMQWAMADERGVCHRGVVTTSSCRHSSPLLCPAHTHTTHEGLQYLLLLVKLFLFWIVQVLMCLVFSIGVFWMRNILMK